MSQLLTWFNMGGYALYVWPAYGLALGLLVMNFIMVKQQKMSIRRKLQQWFKE
ncbi:MAG: heme exporter protein CcmD [Legionella sp.]